MANSIVGGCEIEHPEGFFCSRDFSHNGPCALHPVYGAIPVPKGLPKPKTAEKSGGPTSYYLVEVTNPNQGNNVYTAECGDIIEALKMDFNEGCAFKALWRTAAERTLGKAKEGGDALYDAQKVAFYGNRMQAVLLGHKPKAAMPETDQALLVKARQRLRNVFALGSEIKRVSAAGSVSAANLAPLFAELEQIKNLLEGK